MKYILIMPRTKCIVKGSFINTKYYKMEHHTNVDFSYADNFFYYMSDQYVFIDTVHVGEIAIANDIDVVNGHDYDLIEGIPCYAWEPTEAQCMEYLRLKKQEEDSNREEYTAKVVKMIADLFEPKSMQA